MRLYLGALFLTLILAAASGSLKGAGRHHLLPWLPSVALAAAELAAVAGKPSRRPGASWIAAGAVLAQGVALFSLALRHGAEELQARQRLPGSAIVAELREIMRAHPGRAIEMGYGFDYALSFFRPVLVFEQGSYLLDGAALMDMQPFGLATPPATFQRLRDCDPPLWLFPKGEAPLGLMHVAPPYEPIFSPQFKAEFNRWYRRSESYHFYDLWVCAKAH